MDSLLIHWPERRFHWHWTIPGRFLSAFPLHPALPRLLRLSDLGPNWLLYKCRVFTCHRVSISCSFSLPFLQQVWRFFTINHVNLHSFLLTLSGQFSWYQNCFAGCFLFFPPVYNSELFSFSRAFQHFGSQMCFLKPHVECLYCGVCTNLCLGPSQQPDGKTRTSLEVVSLSENIVVASCPSDKHGYAVTVNRGTWLQTWSLRGGSTRRIFLQDREELNLTCAVGSGRWMPSSWGLVSWTKIRPYFRYALQSWLFFNAYTIDLH